MLAHPLAKQPRSASPAGQVQRCGDSGRIAVGVSCCKVLMVAGVV